MKRMIGVVALLTMAAAASYAPRASAQCSPGILLKWDLNGFSYETPANPVAYVSPAGNVMTNVLAVSLFCSPLAALNPNNAALEYTMVWTGLTTANGTVTAPFGVSGAKYTTVYTGGSFALYEGPVNARPYTAATVPVPGVAVPQYAEGLVILSGTIDSLTTLVTRSSSGSVNGSFRGKYQITGGTLLGEFCHGVGVGLMDGLWFPVTPPAGWSGHNNGKFDSPSCPTDVMPSTWGRLKSLYR